MRGRTMKVTRTMSRGAAVLIAVLLGMVGLATPASAHDYYPWALTIDKATYYLGEDIEVTLNGGSLEEPRSGQVGAYIGDVTDESRRAVGQAFDQTHDVVIVTAVEDTMVDGGKVTELKKSVSLPEGTPSGRYVVVVHDLVGKGGNDTVAAVFDYVNTPAPKEQVTIIGDKLTKVYGDEDPELTYQVTGLDKDESLTTLPTCSRDAKSTESVGLKEFTCSGATADPKYEISYLPGELDIKQAPLMFVADDKTRAVGAANPTLTYTVTGLVNGDTEATAFTGAPDIATLAFPDSQAGTYSIGIGVGTVTSTNYALSFQQGTLTVTAAPSGPAPSKLAPGALVITKDKKGKKVSSITVSAKLTQDGVPVKGKLVTFTVPGITLCSAKTNAAGVATCSIGGFRAAAILYHGGYTATFAGDKATARASVFSRDVRVVKK